jgi:hypothetical protein
MPRNATCTSSDSSLAQTAGKDVSLPAVMPYALHDSAAFSLMSMR